MADHPNTHKQPSQVTPAPGTESKVPSPSKNKWQGFTQPDGSATVLRGAEEQMSDPEVAASTE